MRVITLAAVAAAGVTLAAVAACGSSSSASSAASSPASSAAAAPAASSAAPAPLACDTVTSDNGEEAQVVIATLKSDQQRQDSALEQNWVDLTDGTPTSQGNDLQAAASEVGSYAGTQLSADGSQFATDAGAFMSDESGGLMPGWPAPYDQVSKDIHALATDCGEGWPVPAEHAG
jgi:hypothetical protein